MRNDLILGAHDVLAERPFTDPDNTAREAGMMQSMLIREREYARAWSEERPGSDRGHVLREGEGEGRRQLLVVPDTEALVAGRDVTAIGFFARARDDADHGILFRLEDELVERMHGYADIGLLSYYDLELVKGAYGNLILFSTPDVPRQWYEDSIHRKAVEISPHHYHEIRLHKGSVAGRLLDEGSIVIERTKYFDFTGSVPWQAVRQFGPLGQAPRSEG
jgi:hypothetical protein